MGVRHHYDFFKFLSGALVRRGCVLRLWQFGRCENVAWLRVQVQQIFRLNFLETATPPRLLQADPHLVQFIPDFSLLGEVGRLGVLCGSNDPRPNQISLLFSLLFAKQRPVFVRSPLGCRGVFSLLSCVVLMAYLLSSEMLEVSRLINKRIVIFTHPLFKLQVGLLIVLLRTAATHL